MAENQQQQHRDTDLGHRECVNPAEASSEYPPSSAAQTISCNNNSFKVHFPRDLQELVDKARTSLAAIATRTKSSQSNCTVIHQPKEISYTEEGYHKHMSDHTARSWHESASTPSSPQNTSPTVSRGPSASLVEQVTTTGKSGGEDETRMKEEYFSHGGIHSRDAATSD
ncbi:uncharacterized protein I303_101068 [Kwoniella dejecticola CBS 10117]|uniref:Uncharacterized protein n=1 Tax=Kwoniella dejecticola CBS 10117 TaxID=1296121 RepID=A0A1A6AGQ7_9TREE|nr:uncharacterized protein I303_01071 [Kwoniella dejecticola CBS 10117]OBR89246.1 hypothetical protein I303_01071 [Kwoniella dejecticola CBS 10117]